MLKKRIWQIIKVLLAIQLKEKEEKERLIGSVIEEKIISQIKVSKITTKKAKIDFYQDLSLIIIIPYYSIYSLYDLR